jgi:hypothetical protein
VKSLKDARGTRKQVIEANNRRQQLNAALTGHIGDFLMNRPIAWAFSVFLGRANEVKKGTFM